MDFKLSVPCNASIRILSAAIPYGSARDRLHSVSLEHVFLFRGKEPPGGGGRRLESISSRAKPLTAVTGSFLERWTGLSARPWCCPRDDEGGIEARGLSNGGVRNTVTCPFPGICQRQSRRHQQGKCSNVGHRAWATRASAFSHPSLPLGPCAPKHDALSQRCH